MDIDPEVNPTAHAKAKSDASITNEPITKRVTSRPFGADKAHALMIRDKALATLTRQECFDRGYLTVKDLDDEELRYGRCRDHNGLIPPAGKNYTTMISQEKYDEMVAEHEKRYNERIRQQLDTMLDVMVTVATDDTVEPRDRFEAAKYLFERQAGKTPDKVAHTVQLKPWEGVLTDITGVGAISRAEHRRIKEMGHGAGIIDVEVVDADDIPLQDVQDDDKDFAEQDVVPVHQARPGEPDDFYPDDATTSEDEPKLYIDNERDFRRDPATQTEPERLLVQVDQPQPELSYGSRRTESKNYADQVREAEVLAARRKAARERIQGAKKARKIARATGADAIEDDITGATIGEDGKLSFE